jgi:hypothetical protein
VCVCVCVWCVGERPECKERKGRTAPRSHPREGGERGAVADREAQHQGARPSAAQYPDGTPPYGSAAPPQRQKPLSGIPGLSPLSPSASATCHEPRKVSAPVS